MIFVGITESLMFVVERWNNNQNLQQGIPFHWNVNRFELGLMVFMVQADMSNASKRVIENSGKA